jgi:hypothetical protein
MVDFLQDACFCRLRVDIVVLLVVVAASLFAIRYRVEAFHYPNPVNGR